MAESDDLDEVDEEEEDEEEDVEEEEDDEEEDEEEEGGLDPAKKKLILIVAAAVLLLVLGGAGAFLTGLLDPLFGIDEEKAAEGHDPNESLTKPIYYELPELLVDLKSGRCRAPFLKLTVQLAVATPEDVKILEEVQPYIIDKLKMHLRTLERQDLVGSEGAEKLRFDIVTILNNVARPAKVRTVLYKDFLLQ